MRKKYEKPQMECLLLTPSVPLLDTSRIGNGDKVTPSGEETGVVRSPRHQFDAWDDEEEDDY